MLPIIVAISSWRHPTRSWGDKIALLPDAAFRVNTTTGHCTGRRASIIFIASTVRSSGISSLGREFGYQNPPSRYKRVKIGTEA